MQAIIIMAVIIAILVLKMDPLVALVIGVLFYLWDQRQVRHQALNTLEYWKAREMVLKESIREYKEEEKERRARVREARAATHRRVRRESKQMKMMEQVFSAEDRQNLKLLPPDLRTNVIKGFGLKPEVVDAWLKLTNEEILKKKMGIDDDVD